MDERELLKVFGQNIKRYRQRAGWSQAGLAEKTDISLNFLGDVERGKKWASPITTVKIARVFNIEVYELYKPENILPDNSNKLLEKYTEDMQNAVKRSILKTQRRYSVKLRLSGRR
ncbi:MAG: helix-turn-helix domain-containing protein [Candidatus Margulisbacteria bacterium]|jgi:transcriptional regulator with XRE-family HTH domain|nr:helix-turn-helix domain-containing protein [Candidatus Margulisiibacteriota bacterium]